MKIPRIILAFTLSLTLIAGIGIGVHSGDAVRVLLKTEEEKTITQVIDEVDPAVVSVVVSKDLPILEEYFEEVEVFGNIRVLQQQYREVGTEQQEIGGGTAFFINPDGLLLTNAHVVNDVSANYTVVLNNGDIYDAEIVQIDQDLDLALLEVEGNEPFPIVKFSSFEGIKVGQTVLAVGNALAEFRNTVSKGIVSGIGRNVITEDDQFFSQVIQTDAAINDGNSGGPLLNTRGELIGVNFSRIPGADSVSFAVPLSTVKQFVNSFDTSLLRENNPRLRSRSLRTE